MNWTSSFTVLKSSTISLAIGWGLWSLTILNNNMEDLAKKYDNMQDQYMGLQLTNSKILISLDETSTQVKFQGQLLQSNQEVIVVILDKMQTQIDGIIKYLLEKQPVDTHKLNSYTQEILEKK